jgi:hypothetical protein
MAIYDKTIDLLLVYIDNPAASYTLSFISTMRDSFLSANTMITLLLLSVLSFRALIYQVGIKPFLIPLLSA